MRMFERTRARRSAVVVAALVTALIAPACAGDDEDSAGPTSSVAADQTVEITMVDLAFRPEEVTVRAGTTVRFVFTNKGRIVHDATFGDEAHQQAVESGREKRVGVILNPNKSGDYVRTFTAPGTLLIGCHQAGHYESGMKIRLTVQ